MEFRVRMEFRVLTSKIVAAVRERRAASATRAVGRHLWRKLRGTPVDDFDRRHGTDTSGEVALWETRSSSVRARFGFRYQASREGELVQVVNSLGIDARNFTFIDLGCGKGRTLLIAARLGFRHVIGVEIAPELADIARTNLAKLDVRNALVIHGDAAEYVFPSGGLVVYLYNPFGAPVMSLVIREVEHRIEHGESDEVYVVYKGPTCGPLLDQSRFLRRVSGAHDLENVAVWKGAAR
jgi:SAM-dependent methyltransferase